MKPNDNHLHFFLGANTPQGFVSRFDQLADAEDDWRILVIKGGPGSGKSTIMKYVVEQLQDEQENLEIIHCASDVDSIDAVVIPGLRCAIADGTPPHAIEPRYPGAFESLVNLGACWDARMLFACRKEIIALTNSVSRCHDHCCRFLSAAGALIGDTYRIALDSVKTEKLAAYCDRLAQKELKPLKKGPGKDQVRFLSALTNKGTVCFSNTAKQICDRLFLVNDDFGAVSRLLLHTMRSKALAAGYDVISCYCPLSPFDKLEQLFIPAIGMGFMTSNRFHDFTEEIDPYRVINNQRFSDADALKSSRKRIRFNRKITLQMLDRAETLLQDAKAYHDELEGYYIHATDFAQVDALTQEVLQSITNNPAAVC